MIMAADELRQRAEAGDANAQYLLALKYYKGREKLRIRGRDICGSRLRQKADA